MDIVYKRNLSGRRLAFFGLFLLYPCVFMWTSVLTGKPLGAVGALALLMVGAIYVAQRQRILIGEKGIRFSWYSLPLTTWHRWEDIATIEYVRWGKVSGKEHVTGFLLMRKDGDRVTLADHDSFAASPAYVQTGTDNAIPLGEAIQKYWHGEIPDGGWRKPSSYGQDLGRQAEQVTNLALLLFVISVGLLLSTPAFFLESAIRWVPGAAFGLAAATASIAYQRKSSILGKLLTTILLAPIVYGFVWMFTLATAYWIGPHHQVRFHWVESVGPVQHWQGALRDQRLNLMVPYGKRLPDQAVVIRSGLFNQYVITTKEYRKLDPNL